MRHASTSLPSFLATTVAFLFLLLPAGASGQQGGPSLAVAEGIFTTDVRDREPVDELATVPPGLDRVILWTRITDAGAGAEVTHVWYHGSEEVGRVPLAVAGPSWRTWSSKELLPSWTGPWRVEIVGPNGEVLKTVSLRVE